MAFKISDIPLVNNAAEVPSVKESFTTAPMGIPQSSAPPAAMMDTFGTSPWESEEASFNEATTKWYREGQTKLDAAVLDPEKGFADIDLSFAPDPETARRQVVTDAWMDLNHDEPAAPSELQRRVQFQVASLARFGEMVDSEEALYPLIQKDATKRKDAKALATDLNVSAYDDAMLPGDKAPGYAAFREKLKTHAGYDAEKEADYAEAWHETRREAAAQVEEFREPLVQVWRAFKTDGNVTAAAYDAYKALTPEQRPEFMDALAIRAKALPDEERATFWANLRKQTGLAVSDYGRQAAESFESYSFAPLGAPVSTTGAAVPGVSASGIIAADDQRRGDKQEFQQARNFAADVRKIAREDYDPLLSADGSGTKPGFWEGVAYQVPGVTATSLTMAVPVVGMATMTFAMEGQAYEDMRGRMLAAGKSDEEATKIAEGLAPLIAAPQAALEKVGFGIWSRKLPGFTKVIDALGDKIANRALRFGVKTATIGTAETGIELAQDSLVYGVQDIAAALTDDVPEVDWSKELKGTWASAPEIFATMLPLAILGAAGGLNAESRNAAFARATPTELQALGIDTDGIAAINAANGPSSLASAIASAMETRDPNSETAQAAVDAIKLQLETQRRAQENLENLGYEKPNFVRSANGITVFDADGQELGTAPDLSGAVRISLAHTAALEDMTAEYVSSLTDALEKEQAIAKRDALGTLMEATEAAVKLDPQSTMDVSLRAFDPSQASAGMAASYAQQVALKEQAEGGSGDVSRSVFGYSVTGFAQGLRNTVNHLFDKASVTDAFHETAHGLRRGAHAAGVLTLKHDIDLLRSYDTVLAGKFVKSVDGKTPGPAMRMIPEGLTDEMLLTGNIPAAMIPAEFNGNGKLYVEKIMDEGVSEITEAEVFRPKKGKGKGRLGVARGVVSRNITALTKLMPGVIGDWVAYFRAVRAHWGLATSRAVAMRGAERRGEWDSSTRDAYLDKLLGLDQQTEHDAGVQSEFDRILGLPEELAGDDIPFSIGRIDTNSTGGANIGDGAQPGNSAVTPEMDSAYLDAANSGNLSAAQKLVDFAANAAGYIVKRWHGSPKGIQGGIIDNGKQNRGVTPGLFTTASKRAAWVYANLGGMVGSKDSIPKMSVIKSMQEKEGYDPKVHPLWVKPGKEFKYDTKDHLDALKQVHGERVLSKMLLEDVRLHNIAAETSTDTQAIVFPKEFDDYLQEKMKSRGWEDDPDVNDLKFYDPEYDGNQFQEFAGKEWSDSLYESWKEVIAENELQILDLIAEGGSFVVNENLAVSDYPDLQLLMSDVDVYKHYLKNGGFDTVEYNDGEVKGFLGSTEKTTIILNPDNARLADPILRDFAGNIIPLSQRFNQSPGADSGAFSIGRTDRPLFSATNVQDLRHDKTAWLDGAADTAGTKEMDNAHKAAPETRGWTFDFAGGRFLSANGEEITDQDFEQVVASSNPGSSGIGLSTLQRAIITASAIQEFQRGASETIVESAESDLPGELRGVSYSIGRSTVTPTASTRSFQGAEGSPSVIGPASFSIGAYHGTPHKVDKFTTAKMGTGEGAQAYGWGLYFAASKDVAGEYQKNVKDTSKLDGINRRLSELAAIMSRDEIIGQYRQYSTDEGKAAAKEYDDLMEKRREPGNLYTVTLKVEDEDLLDWDAPYSEQPPKVQEAMRRFIESEYDEESAADMLRQTTGEGFYRAYGPGQMDQQDATEVMLSRGIRGIRYLDGNSRLQYHVIDGDGVVRYRTSDDFEARVQAALGLLTRNGGLEWKVEKQKGSYNYVIFSDSDIEIVEENGTPVDLGAASYSIGPAKVASIMEGNALKRITDPRRRTHVMSRIARDFGNMRLQIERMASLSGIRRSKGDMRREANAREDLRAEELIADVHRRFGEIMADEDLVKIKSQPVHSALADPTSPLRGRLKSKAAAIREHPDMFQLHRAGDYDGSDGVSRSVFGGQRMPDQAAQELYDSGLIPEPTADALWEALLSEQKTVKGMKELLAKATEQIREAKAQAKQEANEWLATQGKDQEVNFSDKEEIRRSLRMLDAIMLALPYEVRGKIDGGKATQMSMITTDEARLSYLKDMLAKADKELETFLRVEYAAEWEALLAKAAPKTNEAGQRPTGSIAADAYDIFRVAESAMGMEFAAGEAEADKWDAIADHPDTDLKDVDMARVKAQMIRLTMNWTTADAARREQAVLEGEKIYYQGLLALKVEASRRRERLGKLRDSAVRGTGKTGHRMEREAAKQETATKLGALKAMRWEFLSFGQVVNVLFGEKSAAAQWFNAREIAASNAAHDGFQAKANSLESLFDTLSGNRFDGEKLRHRMATDPKIKVQDVLGIEHTFTESQAITFLLMYRQEDGKRHLQGVIDEETGNILSEWAWDDASAATIEAGLSPEGRAAMAFLGQSYGEEYGRINDVFRRIWNVSMPRHKMYAPLSVKPVQGKGDTIMDPVSGDTMGAGMTPGSLKNRSFSAIAEPDFKDAFQVYLTHARQMEHFIAYGEFSRDALAIINRRETRNAIEAAGGADAAGTLSKWVDYFAVGGVHGAAMGGAWSKMLGGMLGRLSQAALVGRVSVLFMQSLQLAAASFKMPTGAFLTRFAKLSAGRLQWGDTIKSEYIQRRLSQLPPVVRDMMQGMASGTPNRAKYLAGQLGQTIPGADALFTAGTYAIFYDYHLGLAKKDKTITNPQAHAHAEAERLTDQVAQPTRTGARSWLEVANAGNPAFRAAWNFSSDPRQKMSLLVYAAMRRDTTGKEKAADVAFTAAKLWIIGGVMQTLLRTVLRDLRNDDDDEVFDERYWSPARLALQVITGPLGAVPFLGGMMEDLTYKLTGQYAPQGGMLAFLDQAASLPQKWAKGKVEPIKDLETLTTAGAGFSGTSAAAASAMHIIRDVVGFIENLEGSE